MDQEICENCDTELLYTENSIEFNDDVSGESLAVDLGAYWCSCCGYHRVVRV